jgi:hypothetical protein
MTFLKKKSRYVDVDPANFRDVLKAPVPERK